MNQRISILVGALFTVAVTAFVLTGITEAQDSDAAATTNGFKIGTVDFEALLDEYDKFTSRYEQLEADKNQKQQELDAIRDQIRARAERYNERLITEDGFRGSDADDAMRDEIRDDERDWQEQWEDYQEELDEREKALIQECLTDIREAINTVGAREGYHLILNANREGAPRTGVLYRATTIDLTSRVETELSK